MHEVITSSDIYWITRLDALHEALCVAEVVCCISGAIAAFVWLLASTDRQEANVSKAGRSYFLKSLAAMCVVAPIHVLLPSTKEAVAMLVIPKIANSEDVQGLGSDVVGLAREWMEELRPKHGEKTK